MKLAQPNDAIVLMGNSVYAALEGSEAFSALPTEGVKIYVLRADARAAGVVAPSSIEDIDMDALVTLTERFPRQLAWY